MSYRYRVLVRETAGGVAATVVSLPWVSARRPDRAAALEALRAALVRHLAEDDAGDPGSHPYYEAQDVLPLEVDLRPRSGLGGTLPITLTLVLTAMENARGRRWMVSAPALRFEVSVDNRADIPRRVGKALVKYTRDWPVEDLLAADDGGGGTLDTITLDERAAGPAAPASEDDVLGRCGIELTARAGRVGGADRREDVVGALLAALAGEGPRSVVLVGPGDVGKTAILHEAAARIAAGRAPDVLRDREVWSLTAGALMAGMRFMGDWEERAQRLIAQARDRSCVLAMGDPEEIISAGRWLKSDHNLARVLRPYAESGELSLVVECTPEGYQACVEREPSFMHALGRLDVPEPAPEERAAILAAAARRLEAGAPVRFDEGALATALELTRRFVPYRAFPGKAVRLLHEMARDAPPGGAARTLGRADALAAFARRSGLPEVLLSDAAPLRLVELRAWFEGRLLGQPEAVDAVLDVVTVLKAGLNDPAKPLAGLFFVGPTGVGKTEMAKVLAEFLFGARDRMVRFDMGEYAAADALPRLVGTAWQVDGEGELTRRLRAQPFCVLLLDEIEKAHPEVFDVLLAALGEGRVTDANGRTADLRNAIVIMTSNLGGGSRGAVGVGFRPDGTESEAGERMRAHYVEQAERFFRPEFFNRLDRIVAFRPLSHQATRLIARRELGRLLMREGVVRRSLLVEIDDAVVDRLLERGFHPRYGARPLQREIERAVIVPLARLLVEGAVAPGGVVRLALSGGEVSVRPVHLEAPPDPPDPPDPAPPAEKGAEKGAEEGAGTVVARTEALREAVGAARDEEAAVTVRDEVSALLARTREPDFWDAPEAAREALARIYDLEAMLARLDGLAPRAESVYEWARQVRAHRDRRRLPEVARALHELGLELAYARAEAAAAAAGGPQAAARVRVTPVGQGAEAWAAELRAMYAGWAARRRLESRPDGGSALEVADPRAYPLLRGEEGLHRLNGSGGRRGTLARVVVRAEGATASSAEVDTVVRVYSRGRHRFVRDPRTGVRVTDVDAVLAGAIDEFLLAAPADRALAR